jgi:hypothetical protein
LVAILSLFLHGGKGLGTQLLAKMPSSTSHNMEPVPGAPLVTLLPPAQDTTPPLEELHSPPSDGAEEDDLDVDQEDAQSFMQPAISPLATLLMSPSIPAADKAAAFGRQPVGGIFAMLERDEPDLDLQT